MLFSSVEFILVFLPLTGLLFWLARRYAGVGVALGVLTAGSLAFYAISSILLQFGRGGTDLSDPRQLLYALLHSHLILLIVSVLVNYLLAFRIGPAKGADLADGGPPADPPRQPYSGLFL